MAIADTIEEIRMELGDYLSPAIDEDTGNGEAKVFGLTHNHIQDCLVYVDDELQTEDEDYTLNSRSGDIVFEEAPADGAEIRTEYNFAAFTDTDLTTIYNREGSVNSAVIKAIKMLMMDAARRFDYTHGQTSVKTSQIFQHLKQMLEERQSDISPIILDRKNDYYEAEESTSNEDLSRDDWGVNDEA